MKVLAYIILITSQFIYSECNPWFESLNQLIQQSIALSSSWANLCVSSLTWARERAADMPFHTCWSMTKRGGFSSSAQFEFHRLSHNLVQCSSLVSMFNNSWTFNVVCVRESGSQNGLVWLLRAPTSLLYWATWSEMARARSFAVLNTETILEYPVGLKQVLKNALQSSIKDFLTNFSSRLPSTTLRTSYGIHFILILGQTNENTVFSEAC